MEVEREGDVLEACRRIRRGRGQLRAEDVHVRGRRDRDCRRGVAGRADRAVAEVVAVVAGGDDRNDAGRDHVLERLDQRVARRIGLGAATGEVDHVHPVVHGRLEGEHDLGRECVEAAGQGGHVEDAVVPDPRTRRDPGEPGHRRMVGAGRDDGAGDAGRDPGDVGAVEGAWPPEREPALSAGARPGESARHDHLARRPDASALREAGGIREAGRAEVRVRHVDAVVDDTDLDPLAEAAGVRPERVGVDHRRALVRVEVVAQARIDLAHSGDLEELRQVAVGQAHREAVEDQLVAMEDPRLRDRVPDLPGRGRLGPLEPCEVGLRGRARRVELAARPERLQAGAVARCERREAKPDEHGHASGGMAGRNPDHAVAEPRKRYFAALRQPDRAEPGGSGGGGGENEQRRKKRQNEWAAQEFAQ